MAETAQTPQGWQGQHAARLALTDEQLLALAEEFWAIGPAYYDMTPSALVEYGRMVLARAALAGDQHA